MNSILRRWAHDKFSDIPSNATAQRELTAIHSAQEPAYRIGIETGMRYFVEPYSGLHNLYYFWPISGLELRQNYRSPVLELISKALKSKANGTLIDVLKNRLKLIEHLGVEWKRMEFDNQWSGFLVHIHLTAAGMQKVDTVSMHLIKYLKLLLAVAQNPIPIYPLCRGYFEELKCLRTVDFDFYSLQKSKGTTSLLHDFDVHSLKKLFFKKNVQLSRLCRNWPRDCSTDRLQICSMCPRSDCNLICRRLAKFWSGWQIRDE